MATIPSIPLANALVRAITQPSPVPQGVSYLAIGTIAATAPSVRVDVSGNGSVVQYTAEKLTTYTPTLTDPVLVAVVGQRVVIIGQIG